MGKLVTILIVATLACRLLLRRWPWELADWTGAAAEEARARKLLGVNRSATRQDIIEAHRRLISRVHPDRGGTSDAANAATAARDLLLRRLGKQDRK